MIEFLRRVPVLPLRAGHFGVGIDDDEILLEALRAQDEPSLRIDRETVAVEDQFVVAPHGRAVQKGPLQFLGVRLEHFLSEPDFPRFVRGRGHIDQDFGALLDQRADRVDIVARRRPEMPVVPGILANRDSEPLPFKANRLVLRLGFEISVLVENIVGREQGFSAARDDLLIVQQHGGVVQFSSEFRLAPFGAADEQSHRARVLGQVRHGGFHRVDKVRLFEQVAGRIAAKRQLGRDEQVDLHLDGAVVGGLDLGGIPGDIADGGVELGECDPHCRVFKEF